MGLTEFNFDLGFIGLFLFFGPPIILLIFIGWFMDKINDKIRSFKFKTGTHEGYAEETKYINEKFGKKRKLEKEFPTFSKFKKLLFIFSVLVLFLLVTFLWGWFVLRII